jgi:hypothetical protein
MHWWKAAFGIIQSFSRALKLKSSGVEAHSQRREQPNVTQMEIW